MVPYTDMSVATKSIPTSAAMASMPAPTIKVAPVTDENTDPSGATNSARSPLQKSTRPAALNSRPSPVRQRFLRETKMSLVTSSPRTPTGGQKTTARAHGTPSSAKLEIGRDSFYFSMDLPSSKITPKKGVTPKKQTPARATCSTPTNTAKPDSKARIPTKQTPSPRKNRKSIQQSPTKVLSPTPTKTSRLDTYNDSRPCSPVKRAIELNSPHKPVNLNLELAGRLVPHPEHAPKIHSGCVADIVKEDDYDADAIPNTRPIPNPREFLAPVRKRQNTLKAQPGDIGQLMAKLGSENNSISAAHDGSFSGTGKSKTSPTPLHKASEKLQMKDSLSYTRIPSNTSTSASNVAARIDSGGGSTVIISGPSEVQHGEGGEDAEDGTQCQEDFGTLLDLYTGHQAETLYYPPLQEPESSSMKRQGETRVDSGKQVDCQDTDDTASEVPVTQPLKLSKRAETNPSLMARLQTDTQDVQKSNHCLLGVVNSALPGPTNLTGQPPVPDCHSVTGPQKIRSPCGNGSLRKLNTMNDDPEPLPRVITGSPNRATLSKMPSVPKMARRLPGESTPALTQGKGRDTVVNPAISATAPKKTKVPGTRRSAGTATSSARPARLSASAINLTKTTSTPNKQAPPNTKQTSTRPKSLIPSVNPINTKAPIVSTPKHITSKPVSKPIASTAQHESNLKFPRSILKPTPSSRKPPLQQTRPESYDARSIPRQQATNHPPISRGTNITSHQNPTQPSKRTTLVPKIKAWSQTPIKPTPTLESTTPEGSPPNPTTTPVPAAPPITLAPCAPLQPPRPHHHLPPRYLSPNPSDPVVRRSRASTSPSPSLSPSPSPSLQVPIHEHDPNATRTPSKTIINRLDRAIDKKIAEDARRGLWLVEGRRSKERQWAREEELF